MIKPIFALVDCNNFYTSCEKLFRPDLTHTPVVVLSNNDGCIVSRSKEAKQLGISMAVPLFKVQAEMRKHGIVAFSSNYALYADISQRVMNTLESLVPEIEVYSIDEAFLNLTAIESLAISTVSSDAPSDNHSDNHGHTASTSQLSNSTLSNFGFMLQEKVQTWVGISVCVGIAPTKTLAKLANYAAKKWQKTAGVVDLTDPIRQRKLLALVPVNEVWGIGRKLTRRLEQLGITTALQLADAEPKFIRQHFSVVVERTVRELNGESCLSLEQIAPTKKQILSSRSFGQPITNKHDMEQAISEYISIACQKLRQQQQQQAKHLSIFMRTSAFKQPQDRLSHGKSIALDTPSSDTRVFLAKAMQLVDKLWLNNYSYTKAGVMLSDFYSPDHYQQDLFAPATNKNVVDNKLMQLMDSLNMQQPKTIWFASQGINQAWSVKRDYLSPAYTTNWQDLPRVK